MSILKKIFFLSFFLLILSGLFWGVYNLSFKNTASPAPKESPDNNLPSPEKTKEIISSAKEKISAIFTKSVISPSLSQTGDSLVFYSKDTGQALEIDFFGNNEKNLSLKENPGIINAAWSVDKKGVILKIKNPDDTISFIYHNFENEIDVLLKRNVDEVVWQNNANRIFYKYYDLPTLSRTINVSDPNGQNWKKITEVIGRNISIAQVPNAALVSYWNKPDAYAPTRLQSTSLTSDSTKILFEGNFGADYLWDNSGDHILISHTDVKGGSKMELGVTNNNGGEYKNLGIPTFISKCVWSKNGKTVYYALPGEIPSNSVLPNDYNKGMFHTTDTFWKVNIETGEKNRLVEAGDIKDKYDAADLFLDPGENLLFFINKIDGKLNKISL